MICMLHVKHSSGHNSEQREVTISVDIPAANQNQKNQTVTNGVNTKGVKVIKHKIIFSIG